MLRYSLLAATALLPLTAQAATFETTSTVHAATLHPDAAIIARSLSVDVTEAGLHQIIVSELPVGMTPETMQINLPSGMQLLSLDHREGQFANNLASASRQALTDQLDQLRADRTVAQQAVQAAKTEATFLRTLAKAPSPEATPEQLRETLALIRQGLADANTQQRKAQLAAQGLDKDIAAAEFELNQLGAPQTYARQVLLNVAVDAPMQADLALSYLTYEARWNPLYDLVLNDDGDMLTIVSKANVSQRTGEDWTGTKLTLSTVRTTQRTNMPHAGPWYVDPQPARPTAGANTLGVSRMMKMSSVPAELDSGVQLNEMRDEPSSIILSRGTPGRGGVAANQSRDLGFAADFTFDAPTDLPSINQPRALRVAIQEFDVDLSRAALPLYDSDVYLFAKVSNDARAQFLPGQSSLYRGARYIGSGYFEGLQPGEETEIAFGQDERVRVERSAVGKGVGDRGLLGRKAVFERAYDISLVSFHDQPIEVSILDILPLSENENIEISLGKDTTRGFELDANDTKGLIKWTRPLPANGKDSVRFSYQVLQPDDFPNPRLPN